MSTETRYMRKPLTRDSGDADLPAEFEVAGNAVKPTAVTDANVYPLPKVRRDIDRIAETGKGNVDEVEEFWQFVFRTDSLTSDAQVVLWFHNQWLDQWYPSALLEVKGESLLDSAHGGVYSMPGILGVDYVGVQVSNHAGQSLFVAQSWS